MPTILFICAVGGHGGPVASLRDILPGFTGYRRLCMGPFDPRTHALMASVCDGVVPMERPRGAKAVFRAVRQLRQAIREHEPALLFANGLTEVVISALALTALGRHGDTPVVVWVHNYESPSLSAPASGFVRRKRFTFHAVSRLAASLAPAAGMQGEAVLIPNPLSEEVMTGPPAPSDRVRIGFLGTDRPYKGFDFLPGVIERLRDHPVTWNLFLPHLDKPQWRPMEPLLDDPGLDVRIRGRVSPVSEAYADCDVIFIPSRQESFCRVASEAMVNGRPVVASALSPLCDLLGDDEAGFLVPVGDLDGYATALARLVDDPALRARMAEAGRRRAAPFAVDGIRARWREAVASVLAS
jgi:glycosyltransferase involved in cell wall biosynthesis